MSARLALRWLMFGAVLAGLAGVRVAIIRASVAAGVAVFVIGTPALAAVAILLFIMLGGGAAGDRRTATATGGRVGRTASALSRSWWVRLAAAALGFVDSVVRLGTSARGIAASLVFPVAILASGWALDRHGAEPSP